MLTEHGFAPVSVADLAALRLQLGGYHQISWTGSRTTDLLIVDEDRLMLAHGHPDSDLWQPDTADLTAGFHSDGHEIPVDYDAITDIIDIPHTSFDIPVAELPAHPVARFLLGDTVDGYQRWLTDLSIPYWPVVVPPLSLTRHYPRPFMRPVIMRCTDNWSGLITANADLHTPYGYRATHPAWDGPSEPDETFTPDALTPVADLFNLEARPYTLTELLTAAENSGRSRTLGPALRLIRGGSDLPVSHDTWAPDLPKGVSL